MKPLESTQKWLVPLVTLLGIAVAAVVWLGGAVQSPGERLTAHEAAAKAFHDTLQTTLKEAHKHDEAIESLLEGMVRGECLENPRANLARQGLLPKCLELGISPTDPTTPAPRPAPAPAPVTPDTTLP